MSMRAAHRLVRAVQRRERLAEATALLTSLALPTGLLLTAIALAATRRLGTPEWLAWLGLVPVPLVLLWAALRPRPARSAARLLDAHYQLHDLLGSALELGSARRDDPVVEDPRSADLIALLTADAEAAAATLDPRPVVPLPRPGLRDLLLGPAAALAVLAALFIPPPPPIEPLAVDIEVLQTTTPPLASRPAPERALAEPLREDLRALKDGKDSAAAIAEAMLEVLDAFTRG